MQNNVHKICKIYKRSIRFEQIHTPSLIKSAYALNALKHIFYLVQDQTLNIIFIDIVDRF